MRSATVVADSGPIIHLAMIGRVHLIPALFESVVIPDPVWTEVVDRGQGLPGSSELASAPWATRVAAPEAGELSSLLAAELDPGEAAAIALAVATSARRLLVDDRAARLAAARLDIPVIGTLGILLAARRRGIEAALAPLFCDLRAGGSWMSAELEAAVLAEVGERPRNPG